MNNSKQIIRQLVVVVFVSGATILTCYYTSQIIKDITRLTPTPIPSETPSLTLTPTPTLPDTDFGAVIKDDGNCYSGTDPSYEILATTQEYQQVMVIRKNDAGDWFLIRSKKIVGDCWIEAFRLVYDFDVNGLEITSTPPSPTFTPTATRFIVVKSPTRTNGDNDNPDPILNSNPTNTSDPTLPPKKTSQPTSIGTPPTKSGP